MLGEINFVPKAIIFFYFFTFINTTYLVWCILYINHQLLRMYIINNSKKRKKSTKAEILITIGVAVLQYIVYKFLEGDVLHSVPNGSWSSCATTVRSQGYQRVARSRQLFNLEFLLSLIPLHHHFQCSNL